MDYPNFSPNFAIVRLIRMKINKQNFRNKKAPQSWGIKNINKEKYVLLKGYVALAIHGLPHLSPFLFQYQF